MNPHAPPPPFKYHVYLRLYLTANHCCIIITLSTGQLPPVSLTRITPIDVVNGGVVCPNLHPVEFTCVGVEVDLLLWQRNGNRIGVFTTFAEEGDVLQPAGPLTLILDSITKSGGPTVNVTSRLVGNISDLISGDRITCIASMDRMDTETLNYTLRGN